ncbi:uncharacterized protein [Lepeophtheirus salmonis]|uniref:uncharacterized protein n=1 Tax=Lepeophtheirus salmonis TaxID=72036 RepID=UPI003AF357FA
MSSSLPSHISIQGILDNDKIISLSVAPTKKDIIFDRDKIRPSPKSPYMSQIHPFNQENSLDKNEGKNEFDLKDLEKVIKDLDEDIHLEDWDVEDARDRSRSKSEGSSAQYNKLLENMLVGSNLESL